MKCKKGKHAQNNFKKEKTVWLLIVIVLVMLFFYEYIFFSGKISFIDKVASNILVDGDNEEIKKVKYLKEKNEEVVGWLKIPNTKIDYPILQTKGNEYYLTHNYKREKAKHGSIFLNYKSVLSDNDSNLIIYGHNMGDGQMFNTLLEYENQNYYNEHKTINLFTENQEHIYTIVSVFKSRIFYQDEENVFRYYNYTYFDNKEIYEEFIENCKEIQLYETNIQPKYGEQLITLITCEYSQENGRMVIIAKKEK